MFAQVSHFYPGSVEIVIQLAVHSSHERNYRGFISLAIHPGCQVDCHALGAARTQHGNYVHHLYLLHE
jgi:hypothetical protein